MKTARCGVRSSVTRSSHLRQKVRVPSSSRTLSPIVTLVSWLEYCKTIILVNSMPRLVHSALAKERTRQPPEIDARDVPIGHELGQLRVTVASQQFDRVGRHVGYEGKYPRTNCKSKPELFQKNRIPQPPLWAPHFFSESRDCSPPDVRIRLNRLSTRTKCCEEHSSLYSLFAGDAAEDNKEIWIFP